MKQSADALVYCDGANRVFHRPTLLKKALSTLFGFLAVLMLLVTAPVAIAVPTTPTADFTDNGDGTVTHRITGLTWMRCAMGMTWDGSTCVGAANSYTLEQAKALTASFAGKSDWRLPSMAELSSIVEREAVNPAINSTIFPNIPLGHFWSATIPSESYDHWVVCFSNGGVRCVLDATGGQARLVRGRSFDPLALYTPAADFIDNRDGTVTHIKTGLMWKRCAEGQVWDGGTCSGSAAEYDWDTALALTSSSAGYSDWRLPTANELITIVEYQSSNPAINTAIFPNTNHAYPSFFRTASAVTLNNVDLGWNVSFDWGFANYESNYVNNAGQVRLVRLGQVFSPLGFTTLTGADPNAVLTSNPLSVAGIVAATSITIVGGSYAINGGAYTTAAGTVNPGDSVVVRMTASSSSATTAHATLTIGTVSGDFSVTTKSVGGNAPSVPSNLSAKAGGDNKINLSWTAANDDVATTTYRLYRDDNLRATIGNVTSYVDSGLSAATTYTYRITACDAAYNCSEQSLPISASTPAAYVAKQTMPSSDFTDNGDGTVTHRITGLTWMRCLMGMTWDGSACTGWGPGLYTLDQAVALTADFAGKSDWRLPSVGELSAISLPLPYMFGAHVVWSASPNAGDGRQRWLASFSGGAINLSGWGSNADSDPVYTLMLVRGQSFDPSAPYTPTSDFIDNGDGTVTHRKTGLMWKRCAEGQNWSESTCSGDANYYEWDIAVALTASSAGYSDWRLPTVNELLTIVEFRAFNPATNTTIFPDARALSPGLWSASIYPPDGRFALMVDSFSGGAGGRFKTGALQMRVRLVRAGQLFGPWGFAPQPSVATNTVVTSNALKVTEISGATPVSIVGGSYAINGGAHTTAPGTVNPNDSVTVQVTASTNLATTTRATLTIGSVSGDFSVTTQADTEPPQTPGMLSATTVSANQVDLNWSAAGDNTGITGYRVYRNGELLAVLGNVTSYSDTRLSGATRFDYAVAGCDAANNCSVPSGVAAANIIGSVKVEPILSAGANHAASIKNDGSLTIWGYNDNGQLGSVATTGSRSSPQALGAGYSAVALGASHTAAIRADGSLWTWGGNASGQLGDGATSARNSPMQIATGYIAVAAGNAHTLGIRADGSLWGWGNNGSGQVGDGTSNQHNTPVQIGTGFYTASAGISHSAAIKTDGTLWAWGSNVYGQLGDGTGNDRYAPTMIGNGFTAVAAGAFHTLALKSDGSLWAWGQSDVGQLGDGTTQNRYEPIQIGSGYSATAAGASHSLAVKTDGSVWAWGSNASGQLGDDTTTNRASPVKVPGLSRIVAIAAGGSTSLALNSDGAVFSWGANNSGQLGDGTFTQHLSPVLVVNETNDGFLNLHPGTDFQVPPSAGVPFFVAASGGITDTSATVKTTTKFNAPDVGKSGAVYVTARAASGSMRALSARTASGAATGGTYGAWSALTAADSFELMQLTATGWQPVVGGQLIPYASGVLGDQISAQTILDNTDTTNLKGAQFCVGYGVSAEEMIAAGTMRVVATIPDPNATGATTLSCIVAGSATPLSYILSLPPGWNLVGNSLSQSLSTASLYNDVNTVISVWKWDSGTSGWQFYTPLMDATSLQTYAANKGYGVLTTINAGEGYWVNVKTQPAPANHAGASFNLSAANLAPGWNLVATGSDVTPWTFNQTLGATSLTSLWAWDNPKSAWYFYAPSLEAQGATALSGYIASKGYLDFSSNNKTLGNGTGFWVNR